MGKTSIEWTDASWNPIVGCTEMSPGCANCYAARLASTRLKFTPAYVDLAELRDGKSRWKEVVRFLPERLKEPLHWREPRRIFVCDMGDLFHRDVTDDQIEEVFFSIAKCPQHTFQILTKRADRMYAWFQKEWTVAGKLDPPLPNVWLGVSVENQHFACERIPLLLDTPAAVRWISAEPLLDRVSLLPWVLSYADGPDGKHFERSTPADRIGRSGLDWVICGGESGPNARPMDPEWARSLRDQCQAAGVPFFFKQWGEWIHISQIEAAMSKKEIDSLSKDLTCRVLGEWDIYFKVGKKRAGRLLDGREWNEFPTWPAVERRRARHPLQMLRDCKRLGLLSDRRKDA
jgi:protein gp37